MTQQSDFLEKTLRELRCLEQEAAAQYHGILAQLIEAARRETEMLIREEKQSKRWPESSEKIYARVR